MTRSMRQPHNVHVFVFRRAAAEPEYALFRRSDDGQWQSVSGGVEGEESLGAAARREFTEETGLPAGADLFELDMRSGVQKASFKAADLWPDDLYIVRKHYFAIEVPGAGARIELSREHRECRWLGYADAYVTLSYDDDRNALWELDARIRRDDLRRY
ncbi:NUDIX hydrolase [Dactylosporangium sp. CS-033363]|uniref:NUDIX hydrolase n=1 Tax=Dactylosporangium sp. CS-033363 TaxID=3239935 RepID=UPI003D8B1DBF